MLHTHLILNFTVQLNYSLHPQLESDKTYLEIDRNTTYNKSQFVDEIEFTHFIKHQEGMSVSDGNSSHIGMYFPKQYI